MFVKKDAVKGHSDFTGIFPALSGDPGTFFISAASDVSVVTTPQTKATAIKTDTLWPWR